MGVEVVCFIPCSGRKGGSGLAARPLSHPPPDEEYVTISGLRESRECIWAQAELWGGECRRPDIETPAASALWLYNGLLYQPLDREYILDAIRQGWLRLYIISAGYGVADALEFLHDYDGQMKGTLASAWRAEELPVFIADVLHALRPRRVVGFFAGRREWDGPHAKYRWFFSEGVREALKMGLGPAEAGCFYPQGQGVGAILRALGLCVMEYCRGGDCVSRARSGGIVYSGYPGIVIKYDDLLR